MLYISSCIPILLIRDWRWRNVFFKVLYLPCLILQIHFLLLVHILINCHHYIEFIYIWFVLIIISRSSSASIISQDPQIDPVSTMVVSLSAQRPLSLLLRHFTFFITVLFATSPYYKLPLSFVAMNITLIVKE